MKKYKGNKKKHKKKLKGISNSRQKYLDRLNANQPKKKGRRLTVNFEGFENTMAKQFVMDLKKRPTSSECRVKGLLSHLDIHYVFQMPIKNDTSFYIVDFYFPSYGLCLEVDGGYHNDPEQKAKDKARDLYLVSNGYKVKRITNTTVKLLNPSKLKSLITSP